MPARRRRSERQCARVPFQLPARAIPSCPAARWHGTRRETADAVRRTKRDHTGKAPEGSESRERVHTCALLIDCRDSDREESSAAESSADVDFGASDEADSAISPSGLRSVAPSTEASRPARGEVDDLPSSSACAPMSRPPRGEAHRLDSLAGSGNKHTSQWARRLRLPYRIPPLRLAL